MQAAALLIVSVTILGEENLAAAALNRNHEVFKQRMTPYIGKKVTVIGVLSVGKLSDFIWTDDPGAVYVMATRSADIQKEDDLSRLIGKRLAVTGKLEFRERIPPPTPDVSGITEHFFIDISMATIRTAGVER